MYGVARISVGIRRGEKGRREKERHSRMNPELAVGGRLQPYKIVGTDYRMDG